MAIFGGQYGDEPLDPALAVPLAQIIAGENLPTIIDLSDLSKTQQGTFLYRFLHELRRVNREALTIVLEEADVFAPQNPQGDDSKLLHSEIDWISRRGRFRGFRLISITQRPARLSKDVLTQCSTLIAHKLPAPQDRDAVKAWVEGNGDRDLAKQVFDTLAGLDVGEGWVWSPEHDILKRMRFPRIKTLDTSATPKAGETRIVPKTLAQVDMSGIRKALADARAAKAAEDGKPATASNQGAKIKAPDPAAIEAAETRGFHRGFEAGIARQMENVAGLRADVDAVFAGFMKFFHQDIHAPGPVDLPKPTPGDVKPLPPPAPPKPERAARAAADPDAVPPAATKIAAAISYRGAPAMTWTQIALMTGYKESGGQFRRGKKHLLDSGEVIEEGGGVRLRKMAKDAPPMPTGDELVALWRAKLPPAGQATIDHLWVNRVTRAGNSLGIATVAASLNYAPTGGQWRRGVKALRDAGIAAQSGNAIYFTHDFLKLAGVRNA